MLFRSLIEIARSGVPKYPEIDGYNGSRALLDPLSALIKPVWKLHWAPAGSNWGHFFDQEIEDLVGADSVLRAREQPLWRHEHWSIGKLPLRRRAEQISSRGSR